MGLGLHKPVEFPFQHYSLIESERPADWQSAVSNEIAQHQFSFIEDGDPSASKITCVRLRRSVMFGVRFGATVHAGTAPTNALQLVVPISGQLVSHNRDERSIARRGDALLLSPNAPVDLDWSSDCTAVVVWAARGVLEDLAAKHLGSRFDGDFAFPAHIRLSDGVGLSIVNALGTIVSELDDDSSMFSRGVSTQMVEDCLMTSLLFSSDTIRSAFANASTSGKSSLKRALAYIDAHIDEDITATDLVSATGASLRKLQYDFSRELGIGPMCKVRQEKLKRARTELEMSDPNATTVVDIAARWGFFDRRYFTKVYRREFGELPSATLGRSRFNPRQ